MFAMRRKLLVGIDIGTHSIKVVRLKQKGQGYQLLNFGIMPLRPEAIVDGNIAETEAMVEAIRNLVRMEKIKAKEVATAVSGQSVIVKRIRVPQMTEKELSEAIQGEAEQHIPFEISGLDHGVGHSLLLLYDVNVPNSQNSKEFNGLGHYPSNISLSTF